MDVPFGGNLFTFTLFLLILSLLGHFFLVSELSQKRIWEFFIWYLLLKSRSKIWSSKIRTSDTRKTGSMKIYLTWCGLKSEKKSTFFEEKIFRTGLPWLFCPVTLETLEHVRPEEDPNYFTFCNEAVFFLEVSSHHDYLIAWKSCSVKITLIGLCNHFFFT